jgi:hypothetical protein
VDDEARRFLEAVEVSDLALVATLTLEPCGSATGTAFGQDSGLKLDMEGGWGRFKALKGVVSLQAYI